MIAILQKSNSDRLQQTYRKYVIEAIAPQITTHRYSDRIEKLDC